MSSKLSSIIFATPPVNNQHFNPRAHSQPQRHAIAIDNLNWPRTATQIPSLTTIKLFNPPDLSHPTPSTMTSTPAAPSDEAPRVGPHPGFISSSNQYTSETRIRLTLKDGGGDPAREHNYCLQGIQLIDNVREYLKLPVRTFDTACTYYHKFRLNFADADYSYQDAALASLFVACKVEDTIKKSRDILAAAYNIKNPDKPMAADDKVFESRIIIGLERQILETIGFDFRTRYPQKLLVKIVREMLGREDGREFFKVAYAMCIDMYKTFIPIKRTTLSMTMAVVELTARMTGNHLDKVEEFAAKRAAYHRSAVMETMLDLLDLYVQHYKSTKIGALFDLNKFMDIKIQLNHDLEKEFEPRYLFYCQKCDSEAPQPPTPVSANPATDTSVRRTLRGKDGTVRFIYDPEAARAEKDTIATYFKEEFEEHEIEVEEPVPPPSEPRGDDGHGPGQGHGRRGGGYRGGGRGDRRGGPYHRGDRHGHRGHRVRGRYH